MKALTVYQPWASLIMEGFKPNEYRKWDFSTKPALRNLIGQRIVMHASARPVRRAEVSDLMERITWAPEETGLTVSAPLFDFFDKVWKDPTCLPLSSALGTVIIGQPLPVAKIHAGLADSDRLDQHKFGWPVSEPVYFQPPRPMKGWQGFWNAPEGEP